MRSIDKIKKPMAITMWDDVEWHKKLANIIRKNDEHEYSVTSLLSKNK